MATASNDLQQTSRSRLRRIRERGSYDRQVVNGILDAMPLCHIAYVVDGSPIVMPTLQWREGERVYWHASNGGRGIKAAMQQEVCLTVSLLDGLVLARSGLHHSANYRSVMLFGQPEVVNEPSQKAQKLNGLIDGLFPGRSAQLRPMKEEEIKQTAVLSLPITEGSAKVRNHGVVDDEADYDQPVWCGTLPLRTQVMPPEPDSRNLSGLDVPDYVKNFQIG